MALSRLLTGLTVATLALAGCQPGESARNRIRVVGSSTVYPFTTAVAEQFARKNVGAKAPIVEATGTGAGMKLFCAGVGARFPDVENASRRIKKSEYEDCRAHGVVGVIEVQIGIDGIALAESRAGSEMRLSPADVYAALAASPYGRKQTARTWHDVNPALPAVAIKVYGPPPTSGTRDAFAELILDKGCGSDAATAALKTSDPDRFKEICTRIREDGAYAEAGENDNLIVQKLVANPDAVGIFGYASLEENDDRLRGIPLDGVAPSYDSIASYAYPGARPLYIYVKQAHLNAVPGLRAFVAEYAKGWNPGGYLARRGLISAPDAIRARNVTVAQTLPLLDPAGLE